MQQARAGGEDLRRVCRDCWRQIFVHVWAFMCIYTGGCQNYDPFWGTLDIRCRNRDPKGTIIFTTTHILTGTDAEKTQVLGCVLGATLGPWILRAPSPGTSSPRRLRERWSGRDSLSTWQLRHTHVPVVGPGEDGLDSPMLSLAEWVLTHQGTPRSLRHAGSVGRPKPMLGPGFVRSRLPMAALRLRSSHPAEDCTKRPQRSQRSQAFCLSIRA